MLHVLNKYIQKSCKTRNFPFQNWTFNKSQTIFSGSTSLVRNSGIGALTGRESNLLAILLASLIVLVLLVFLLCLYLCLRQCQHRKPAPLLASSDISGPGGGVNTSSGGTTISPGGETHSAGSGGRESTPWWTGKGNQSYLLKPDYSRRQNKNP